MICLIYGLTLLSVEMKHFDQRQLGEDGVYFTLELTGSMRKLGQELQAGPGGRNGRKGCAATLFTSSSLSSSGSASFPIQLRPTCIGMTPPTVV